MLKVLVALIVMTAPAMAGECAEGSSSTALTVEDWSVEKVQGLVSGMDIAVKVTSHLPKAFRMIDGSYTFEDALGRRIAGFKFDPDLHAKPDQTVESATGYLGTEMDRVPGMNRADVKVYACVAAVVYDDGTKATFN